MPRVTDKDSVPSGLRAPWDWLGQFSGDRRANKFVAKKPTCGQCGIPRIIQEFAVVITGSRSSGKSSLAHILRDHYSNVKRGRRKPSDNQTTDEFPDVIECRDDQVETWIRRQGGRRNIICLYLLAPNDFPLLQPPTMAYETVTRLRSLPSSRPFDGHATTLLMPIISKADSYTINGLKRAKEECRDAFENFYSDMVSQVHIHDDQGRNSGESDIWSMISPDWEDMHHAPPSVPLPSPQKAEDSPSQTEALAALATACESASSSSRVRSHISEPPAPGHETDAGRGVKAESEDSPQTLDPVISDDNALYSYSRVTPWGVCRPLDPVHSDLAKVLTWTKAKTVEYAHDPTSHFEEMMKTKPPPSDKCGVEGDHSNLEGDHSDCEHSPCLLSECSGERHADHDHDHDDPVSLAERRAAKRKTEMSSTNRLPGRLMENSRMSHDDSHGGSTTVVSLEPDHNHNHHGPPLELTSPSRQQWQNAPPRRSPDSADDSYRSIDRSREEFYDELAMEGGDWRRRLAERSNPEIQRSPQDMHMDSRRDSSSSNTPNHSHSRRSGTSKPRKPKAQLACTFCRTRKLKCASSAHSAQCGECEKRGIACELAAERESRQEREREVTIDLGRPSAKTEPALLEDVSSRGAERDHGPPPHQYEHHPILPAPATTSTSTSEHQPQPPPQPPRRRRSPRPIPIIAHHPHYFEQPMINQPHDRPNTDIRQQLQERHSYEAHAPPRGRGDEPRLLSERILPPPPQMIAPSPTSPHFHSHLHSQRRGSVNHNHNHIRTHSQQYSHGSNTPSVPSPRYEPFQHSSNIPIQLPPPPPLITHSPLSPDRRFYEKHTFSHGGGGGRHPLSLSPQMHHQSIDSPVGKKAKESQGSAKPPPKISSRSGPKIVACNYCRARKTRCDGETPCSNCQKRNLPCQYQISAREAARRKRAQNVDSAIIQDKDIITQPGSMTIIHLAEDEPVSVAVPPHKSHSFAGGSGQGDVEQLHSVKAGPGPAPSFSPRLPSISSFVSASPRSPELRSAEAQHTRKRSSPPPRDGTVTYEYAPQSKRMRVDELIS